MTGSTALSGAVAANAVLVIGDGVVLTGDPTASLALTTGTLLTSGGTTTGNTVSVPVIALGTGDGVFLTNTGTSTVSGSITGTGGQTIGGGGTLALPVASGLTGAVAVNVGTVSLGSGAALGSGTITLTAGTLAASNAGGVTVANALALNNYAGTTTINANPTGLRLILSNGLALGNGAVVMTTGTLVNNTGNANLALANAFTFANGVVTLSTTNRTMFAGPVTVTGNNQFTVTLLTFLAGVVGGTGSINLLGGNALVMLNPNNTYSGGTNVGGGNLQVVSSSTATPGVVTKGPHGTGAVNPTGGVIQNANTNVADYSVNSVTLHNALTLINAATIIGGPAVTTAGAGGDMIFGGPVTVGGENNNVGVAVDMNVTMSGTISGTGNLNRAGATNTGALLLSGNNTFTGGVTVTAGGGVLGNVGNPIVGSDTALGTGVVTLNGGTLQDDGLAPRTLANPIVLAAGTVSTVNAPNPTTPFTLTGRMLGGGGLTKGFANLSTYAARMNAVQTITLGAGITGGTFTLTLNGATTGNITWDASGATLRTNIQNAVNALPAAIVGVFQPVVTGTGPYSLTFQNMPVGATVAAVPTVSLNTAGLTGTVTSSVAATMGSGTLVLAGPDLYTGATVVNHGTLTLSGGGQLAGTSGTNAAQTITFGTVTGGTFTLTLNGQTTAAIQWSATTATLQANILTALAALPNVGVTNGAYNVAVSNAANPVVTFVNASPGRRSRR